VIRQLRIAGKSLRDVAAELNARGIRTRPGGSWRFEFVRSLVRRQRPPA
jgi:recombinase